jgi:alkylation response protein AidB-like acyl-CoA dehydrogenase
VLGDVLAGARIGNGLSERGTKHAWDPQTRLSRGDDGQLVLNGSKYYTTGALTSDWIGFSAKDDDGRVVLVIVPRDVEGLELTDEWTSFGQRTTISGPAVLTNVGVEPEQVLPLYLAFEGPVLAGAFDQLLHAAIDTGVARAALEDAGRYVRERSRPWFESSAEKATDEPEVVYRFGELGVKVNVAEAALRDAARTLDEVGAGELTDENTARASIAVASAKAFAGAVGVEVASALFELAGTSATDAAWGLDRHWRNVRTHSLHDPVRWKYRHVGAYVLNGTLPPRHPLI